MKKLAFISGDTLPARVRLEGYLDAAKKAGLSPDSQLQVLMRAEDSIYTIVSRVVKLGADALFVPGSSMQAIEALHVLGNVMGLTVPDDISLIGGESMGISAYQHPPLTTTSEPLQEMAKAAVNMVLTLADNRPVKERVITLPVGLIERASVR